MPARPLVRPLVRNLSFGLLEGPWGNGEAAPVISITPGESGYAGSTYISTDVGQWTRDGSDIVGEAGLTYLTVTADDGHVIRQENSNAIQMWTPQIAIDAHGGICYDYADNADGALAAWPERSGLTAMPLVQGTPNNQPIKSAAGVDYDGSNDSMSAAAAATVVEHILLPDVPGMTAGKGFCGTGLCNIPGTNIYFGGNHGLNGGGDVTYASSVVKFTWDGPGTVPTLIANFAMAAQIPGIESIQAVNWDPIRGTVWFMDVVNGEYREMNPDTGILTGNHVTCTGFSNGASIVGDDVWATENSGGSNRFQKYNLTSGAAIGSPVASGITAIDMPFYHEATNTLWVSYGVAPGTSTIRAYSLATGSPVNTGVALALPATVDCIEAILAKGPYLFVMCNSDFHGGASGLNELIVLRMLPLVTDKLTIALTYVVEGTSATANALFVLGAPAGASNTVGIGVYESNTPNVNCTVCPANGQQQAVVSVGQPALTSMRIHVIEADAIAETVAHFFDGIACGSGSISNVSGWIGLCLALRISTDTDNPTLRLFNGKMKGKLLIAAMGDRAKIEGYLAHKHGLTGNISGHIYEILGPRVQ